MTNSIAWPLGGRTGVSFASSSSLKSMVAIPDFLGCEILHKK